MMTGEGLVNGPQRLAVAWLMRFPPRLRREGRRLGLMVLGHFIIFALALGNDEIIAACVSGGLLEERHAGTVELIVGVALFVGWSVLTIAIMRMVDRARTEALAEMRREE